MTARWSRAVTFPSVLVAIGAGFLAASVSQLPFARAWPLLVGGIPVLLACWWFLLWLLTSSEVVPSTDSVQLTIRGTRLEVPWNRVIRVDSLGPLGGGVVFGTSPSRKDQDVCFLTRAQAATLRNALAALHPASGG